jgi:hypothetical protein
MKAAKANVKQAKAEHEESVTHRQEYVRTRNAYLKQEADELRDMVAASTAAQLTEDKEKIARITAENSKRREEFRVAREKREAEEKVRCLPHPNPQY